MRDPLPRGPEPPSCPEAGGFPHTMRAQFGYLQRALSRAPGVGKLNHVKAGGREGEHHQFQDFLLSWLRFPCLYIAPSCHSLWAHSWEETAGRMGRMQVGVPPSPAGCQHRHRQRLAWLPQLQAGHEAFLPLENIAPRILHTQPRPWISPAPPCEGHMCKRERLPCWGVMKSVLSQPSFSADSAASGRGCCWGQVRAHLCPGPSGPRSLCADPKAGGTGSAGRASGWPCPVCHRQLGWHRDGHCQSVPASAQAAVLLPSRERSATPQPGAPSRKSGLAEPRQGSAPALTTPSATGAASLQGCSFTVPSQSPLCPQGSV